MRKCQGRVLLTEWNKWGTPISLKWAIPNEAAAQQPLGGTPSSQRSGTVD